MDPTYPLVPIANFIAFALTLIPLLHVGRRPWNAGVFVFALWLSLICLSTAINTTVWSNDVEDRAPVWCDICKPRIIFLLLSYTTEILAQSNAFIHACQYWYPGLLVDNHPKTL